MLLRRKEKLYCAFVDFTKTFDRVPLKEMFESMGSMEHLRELWGGGYCGVSVCWSLKPDAGGNIMPILGKNTDWL